MEVEFDYRSEETKQIFNAYCEAHKLKKRTRIEYWNTLGMLCKAVGKDVLCINDEDAKRFKYSMESRIKDAMLSYKTVRMRLMCCDSFFDFLYRNEYVKRNPFAYIQKPDVDDTPYTSQIPTADECDAYLEAAEKVGTDVYLMLAMVLRMGITASDLCAIKTAHVFLFDELVYLYLFDFDGKRQKREIVVPDDLKFAVLSYKRSVTTEYLFTNRSGGKLSVKTLGDRLRKVQALSGCKRFSLKDFRNRAIYQMIHDGAKIDDVADYTNLTTRRVMTFETAPLSSSHMLSSCPSNISRLKIVGSEEIFRDEE